MVWVQIPSREETNLTALKSNSSTVWYNFQTYIYIYIYIRLKIKPNSVRIRFYNFCSSLDDPHHCYTAAPYYVQRPRPLDYIHSLKKELIRSVTLSRKENLGIDKTCVLACVDTYILNIIIC